MQMPTEREARQLDDVDIVLYVMYGFKDIYVELVHRYQDKIYSLMLHRLGNRDDALDASQEVFVRAYKNLETFKGQSAFFSWLYRIATNTASDWHRLSKRKAGRNVSMSELEEDLNYEPVCNSSWASPEKVLKRRELKIALQQAIGKLSDNLQGAFLLHDVLGYSQEQTAECLRIPQGTVKSRINRARKVMRQMLADHVLEDSGECSMVA